MIGIHRLFKFAKKLTRFLCQKLHEKSSLPYNYYQWIGIFNKFRPLYSFLADAEKICIVSKGASLAELPDEKIYFEITQADLTILVSSVDIQNHPVLSKLTYDMQVVGRVDDIEGYVPVFPKQILDHFEIGALCVNSNSKYLSGLALYRFYKFFSKLGLPLYSTEGGISFVSEDARIYNGKGLTIIQKIISHCLMSKKLKTITFLGVDFYGTGYLDSLRDKEKNELSLFPEINTLSTDPRNNRGIPLIRYLIALANSPKMSVQLCFPEEIVKFIPHLYKRDFETAKKITIF